jgi:tetratricopeptide (TPR) repeat protein
VANIETLAIELIDAQTEPERKSLLSENLSLANLELAFALKEVCYKFWTIEPIKAQQAALALDALARTNSEPKIVAVKTWINGIAEITRGENENAVGLLDQAADQFCVLAEDLLAAQTQVSKIYALALLGKYEQAIETGNAALAVFEQRKDFFAAARLEHNLGNISWRRDRYKDAEKYYESAWQRYLALNDQKHLAMLENSYAVIKTFQNDFRAAELLYSQSLARAKVEKMFVTEAEIEAGAGNLAFFRGRYDEALKHLERSRRNYSALKMPHQAAVADLEIADVYLELNLLNEAIDVYERVAPEFERLKMKAEEARARAQFGRALADSKRFDEALNELRTAQKLYLEEENAIGEAAVKMIKAGLLLDSENFIEAKNLAQEAAAAFKKGNNPRRFLFSRWLVASAEERAGNLVVAKNILRETLKSAVKEELPEIIWLSETALGRLAGLRNNFKNAERHFKNAVTIIEKMRAPLAADEFRTAYLANRLSPYHELANIFRRKPKTLFKSFVWTERARSQALLNLLGESVSDPNIAMTPNVELQKRLEELREELNWFYNLIHRRAENADSQSDIENWQAEIRLRERETNNLILQAEAESEKSTAITTDFDLRKLQKTLGAENRVLIEFADFQGELAAFVADENELGLIENLGKSEDVQKILEQLHFQFGTLRYGARAVGKHLPELKRRAHRHLNNLYEMLLAPLEDRFGDKSLVIVPTGNLHYVPFHALYDGNQFVIEKRAVSYAPSAGVLQFLLEKSKPKFEKILAVGFADERVPQVEREVLNLAETSAKTRVLTGSEATFAAVRENLKQNFDVLHLACHGQFRAENPLFSSLHLADGWATVRDAAKLNLRNSLVVLSACETGLSRIAGGDELLGLVRGFLAAGANALVLTLWTVNDESAAVIMNEFYQNLQKNDSLATSLRKAQLKFIEQDFHPYFWSPFALVGRW